MLKGDDGFHGRLLSLLIGQTPLLGRFVLLADFRKNVGQETWVGLWCASLFSAIRSQ